MTAQDPVPQLRVEPDVDRGLVLIVLPIADARLLGLRLLRAAGQADERKAS